MMEIRQWLASVLSKAKGKPLAPEGALEPMDAAIDLWTRMYQGRAPWLSSEVVGMNLPAFIAAEVARIATVEMESRVTGGIRAAFLNSAYSGVVREARTMVEYAAAGGSLVLKPYVCDGKIAVDAVRAGMFIPTAFDAGGNMSGCAFLDRYTEGDAVYTRVEHHTMEDGGARVRNMAFRSRRADEGIGDPVPLAAVPKWADMLPDALVLGVKKPLYAVLRMPYANHIDLGSPLGVSCFARAVDLIREADKQFSRLLWEMESGQRALYVDIRAFEAGEALPGALPFKRFYRTIDAGGAPEESLFEAWSPELREGGQIAALSCILERIEDVCGFSHGTLAAAQDFRMGGARTATELSMMRQRTYAMVRDVQKRIELAFTDLLQVMDCWATIAGLCPPGEYGVSFDFDDSIACNRELAFKERMELMRAGVISEGEMRVWYLGEARKETGEV